MALSGFSTQAGNLDYLNQLNNFGSPIPTSANSVDYYNSFMNTQPTSLDLAQVGQNVVSPYAALPSAVAGQLNAGRSLGNYTPADVQTGAQMYDLNSNMTGGGNNPSLNWGNISTGIQGLQALGNLYLGSQAMSLAKRQFAASNDMANKNYANSVQNYNTELAHKAQMRYGNTKSQADIDAYVKANSL